MGESQREMESMPRKIRLCYSIQICSRVQAPKRLSDRRASRYGNSVKTGKSSGSRQTPTQGSGSCFGRPSPIARKSSKNRAWHQQADPKRNSRKPTKASIRARGKRKLVKPKLDRHTSSRKPRKHHGIHNQICNQTSRGNGT